MGKIRVKTIGIEEDEKDQKKKAKQKAEAKRIEAAKKEGADAKASAETTQIETPKNAEESSEKPESETQRSSASGSASISDEKPKSADSKAVKQSKYKAKTSKKKQPHSSNYLALAKMVDKNKKYSIDEALKILTLAKGRSASGGKKTKLDETVELHINTNEQGVSGNLTLPHGTGKKMRVEVADNAADPKHLAELVKKIESGKIDFDILIATPESMTHLAKIARFLGPKGLMPNPKNGTINPKPKEAMKKFEGGLMNFKTEAKAPIIHMTVGKLSFEEKQLIDNIKAVLQAIKTEKIKNITLKSTMSPGIKISI